MRFGRRGMVKYMNSFRTDLMAVFRFKISDHLVGISVGITVRGHMISLNDSILWNTSKLPASVAKLVCFLQLESKQKTNNNTIFSNDLF